MTLNRSTNLLAGTPVLGDQYTADTPSGAGSADIISAATNVGGIIITWWWSKVSPASSYGATLTLTIGGDTVAVLSGFDETGSGPQYQHNFGGPCHIEIPAGQAVARTLAGSGTPAASTYLKWRHK